MGNNPSGIVTGDDAGGQCGAHSTSVESSSMVSSAPVPASRLPMPLASQGVYNPTGTHSPATRQGTQGIAGGMAYIRRSCEERESFQRELLTCSWHLGGQIPE